LEAIIPPDFPVKIDEGFGGSKNPKIWTDKFLEALTE